MIPKTAIFSLDIPFLINNFFIQLCLVHIYEADVGVEPKAMWRSLKWNRSEAWSMHWNKNIEVFWYFAPLLCFIIGFASNLLYDFYDMIRKIRVARDFVMKQGEKNKHLQFEIIEFIMEAQKDERLAEVVRKFPVLYEETDRMKYMIKLWYIPCSYLSLLTCLTYIFFYFRNLFSSCYWGVLKGYMTKKSTLNFLPSEFVLFLLRYVWKGNKFSLYALIKF